MATSSQLVQVAHSRMLVAVMEFDYQWVELPDPNLEYTESRILELLDYAGLKREFFSGKSCLDAGCGTGRWTWAMLQMGSHVDSFDISEAAVKSCRKVNPEAYVFDLMDLTPSNRYDFVLCWGVLHHLPSPIEGFRKVASQVKQGGFLHVMVYHTDTQKIYEPVRRIWKDLSQEERLAYCRKYASEKGGTIHGWWDAFNPRFNWGLHQNDVRDWFKKTGFDDIRLIKKYNINMIGRKRQITSDSRPQT